MSNENRSYKDKETLEELYVNQRKTMEEVAEELGCGSSTVRRWLVRFDIRIRNNAGKHEEDYECVDGVRKYNHKETLQKLYVDKKMSASEVADEIGCSVSSVYRGLERNNIEKRSKADENRRRLSVDRATFYTNPNGYEEWTLHNVDESTQVRVHQLLIILEGADPHKVFSNGEYQVHHKNGIPWDNRPDNIELLSLSDHMREHVKNREKERGRWV